MNMNLNRIRLSVVLAGVAGLFATAARAEFTGWNQVTLAQAKTLATNQNKLIFLLAGRGACANCSLVKYTVCDSTNPPVRDFISQAFVPWYVDIDQNTEFERYETGLTFPYSLPLLVFIDPAKSDKFLFRLVGPLSSGSLYYYMQLVATRYGPMVTNLMPNQKISDPGYAVSGVTWSHMNATGVWCRVGGGAWVQASSAANWQMPLSSLGSLVNRATNIFYTYAKTKDGKATVTNSVAFVYDTTVQVGPTIVDQPDPVSVLVGGSASFTVGATGPDLSYHWRKDGARLTNNARISGASAATLTLTGLVTGDTGNYSVIVSNSVDTDISATAYLSVTSPPPPFNIVSQPLTQATNVGSPASFRVVASQTTGLTYQWYYNGQALAGRTQAELPGQTNAGSYFCVVSGSGQSITSAPAGLWLTTAPRAYFGMTVFGPVGQRARLEYVTDVQDTNWTALPPVTISNSPQALIDATPSYEKRFYRTVVLP